MARKIDDIDGMLDDIRDNLLNTSKSDLVDWIMELNFHDMEEADLIHDYENFYGDIQK